MVASVRRGCALALVALADAASAQAPAPPPAMARFEQLRAMPLDDPATRTTLEREQLRNPPYYLFELARRALAIDPDAAARWVAVALIRVRYDGLRCKDPTAVNGLGMLAQLAGEAAQRLTDPAVRDRAFAAAAARPDLFAATASPLWACAHGLDAYSAGTAGRPRAAADALRPAAEWPALQAQLRQQLASSKR